MFEVRAAEPSDAPAIERVIRSRAEWMRQKGLADWDAWMNSAELMAARATRPGAPARLLVHEDGTVIGCTTVSAVPSDEAWTAAERAESALYLNTTCTDPRWRAHRPGALLASWAVGEAAACAVAWVRRSCSNDALMRYYRDVQGFTLVRTLPAADAGRTHLLACPGAPHHAPMPVPGR